MLYKMRCTISELRDSIKCFNELPHVELTLRVYCISEGEGSLLRREIPACKFYMSRLRGMVWAVRVKSRRMKKDIMIIIWKIILWNKFDYYMPINLIKKLKQQDLNSNDFLTVILFLNLKEPSFLINCVS